MPWPRFGEDVTKPSPAKPLVCWPVVYVREKPRATPRERCAHFVRAPSRHIASTWRSRSASSGRCSKLPWRHLAGSNAAGTAGCPAATSA